MIRLTQSSTLWKILRLWSNFKYSKYSLIPSSSKLLMKLQRMKVKFWTFWTWRLTATWLKSHYRQINLVTLDNISLLLRRAQPETAKYQLWWQKPLFWLFMPNHRTNIQSGVSEFQQKWNSRQANLGNTSCRSSVTLKETNSLYQLTVARHNYGSFTKMVNYLLFRILPQSKRLAFT